MPGYENPILGKRIFELSPVEQKLILSFQAIWPPFWNWAQRRDYRHQKNCTRSDDVYWHPNLALKTIKSIFTSRLRGITQGSALKGYWGKPPNLIRVFSTALRLGLLEIWQRPGCFMFLILWSWYIFHVTFAIKLSHS